MAIVKLDPKVRKAIREAQQMISQLAKEDGNEAETRRRVERLFESLMGYDVFKHITREHAVRGVAGAFRDDVRMQRPAEQGEVADQIEHLVAQRLVGEAHVGAVRVDVVGDDDGVLFGRTLAETGLAKGGDLVTRYEGASRRDLLAEALQGQIVGHRLADRARLVERERVGEPQPAFARQRHDRPVAVGDVDRIGQRMDDQEVLLLVHLPGGHCFGSGMETGP